MINFRTFLEQATSNRKYISIRYDAESQRKLREWAEENGFDLSVKYNGEEQDPKDFDFHTTIFYSTNEISIRNREVRQKPSEVVITGIKLLGENEDIPVLTVSLSGGIKDLRRYYEDLGLKDQWPSYQPHISISYAKKKVDIKGIDLPEFKPKYDRIVIKDIED
jgi:2'-5' RNA ligase